MNNQEIDEFMAAIDQKIDQLPDETPPQLGQIFLQNLMSGTALRLLAELVKRLPEPETKSAEETVSDAISKQGW